MKGKLNRSQGSQQHHRDVIGTLNKLCTDTIGHVKTELSNQKASDEAEARRLQEEEEKRADIVRLAAEQEALDRAAKLREMETAQHHIEAAQCELKAKRQALRDARKANNIFIDDDVPKAAATVVDNDDDEDDEDRASISTVGEQQVCIIFVLFFQYSL